MACLETYLLTKGNEWIYLPPAVLAIIVTIARSKNDHVRSALNINGFVVKIIKILDKILIVDTL